jgi:hypothetical protein
MDCDKNSFLRNAIVRLGALLALLINNNEIIFKVGINELAYRHVNPPSSNILLGSTITGAIAARVTAPRPEC